MVNSVVIKPNDTVATATEELQAGDTGNYLLEGKLYELPILETIPQYHKFAIKEMHTGDHVYKYGEKIGVASCDIKRGAYVHVHNLESERA
ncbi:MAG: UxaA family hydrolase [Lachnospiraceae bacterium]|nr:UxaA family hydrolase [Lachnospiraceae bacterium]